MGLQYSPENKKVIEAAIAAEIAAIDTQSRRELLASIHDAVYHLNTDDATKIARAQARFATLLVSVSEAQEKSAEALERYTRTLISLTWALVWLTVGVLIFTICLAVAEQRPHP